jgi:hypothetical protein
MPSIIDALQKELVKDEKLGKKLGKMLSAKLDNGLPGRVFNDFPALLPAEELNKITSDYIAILENAQTEKNAEGIPELKTTDKHTIPAFLAWQGELVTKACAYLLDLSGSPSESLMQFLELDDEHRAKLIEKVEFMLSSFTENIVGLAGDKLSLMPNYRDYLDAYACITNIGNESFKGDYYKIKQEQYVHLVVSLFEATAAYKIKIGEMKETIEAKQKGTMTESESVKLAKQISAIDRTVRSINRFVCGTVSPQEFLAELKNAQTSFKQQKAFAFIKWEVSDSSNDQFIQTVDRLIKDFQSPVKTSEVKLSK